MIRWSLVAWTLLILVGLSALSPLIGGELPAGYREVMAAIGTVDWTSLARDPWMVAVVVGFPAGAMMVLGALRLRARRVRPAAVPRPEESPDRWSVASRLAHDGEAVAVIARQTELAQDAVRELLFLARDSAGLGGTNFRAEASGAPAGAATVAEVVR